MIIFILSKCADDGSTIITPIDEARCLSQIPECVQQLYTIGSGDLISEFRIGENNMLLVRTEGYDWGLACYDFDLSVLATQSCNIHLLAFYYDTRLIDFFFVIKHCISDIRFVYDSI